MRYSLALIPIGVAVGALAIVTVASAQAPKYPPPPPAQHTHTRLADSQKLHSTGGPYIAETVAVDAALRAGSPGDAAASPRTDVSATLLTVREATAALGGASRPVTDGVADDREVWLVKVHGQYTAPFAPYGTTVRSDHYYVIVDATTGELLGTGTGTPQSRW